MLNLSDTMQTVRDFDLHSYATTTTTTTSIDKFLTYVALFYYYDERGHMRLVGSVDDIYPSRLKEIGDTKHKVDNVVFKNGNPLRFHFGLISDLLENEIKGEKEQKKKNEGWMKNMTYIMSSIFTKKQIDETYIAKILLAQARSYISKHTLKKLKVLEKWHQLMLKATLILEYLHRVGTLATDNHIRSNILPTDNKIAVAAAKFLDSHSGMLHTKELRAVCAIGIAVGVIIKAQQRYMKSDSFISRLNRLEMDYIRRQAWPKLKHYNAEEYGELFTYYYRGTEIYCKYK